MNDFYEECAKILGVDYECEGFPYRKRTRWNNRKAGNGRFPGFGIIRVYGDVVHVALRKPIIHQQIFNSKQEALDFLRQIA